MGFRVLFLVSVVLGCCFHGLTDADNVFSIIDKLFKSVGTTMTKDLLPLEQEITFWCFLPGGQSYNQVFINDPNADEKLDFTQPINFVVHGYFQSFRGGMMKNYEGDISKSWVYLIASEWSKYANANTCAVDWSKMAATNYIDASGRNAKLVGRQMVEFAKPLIRKGMIIQMTNVASHSLGAHVAGFFGRGFSGQINTIFGLDPAGPGFTLPVMVGVDDRLDPTDAKFVQCLHTSALLGTQARLGHAVYKANHGEAQPGCGINMLCDHSRATDIFLYSLNPNNVFVGTMCAGTSGGLFSNILLKLASLVTQKMCYPAGQDRFGIYTNRYGGMYNLPTTDQPPYAVTVQA